MERCTFCALVSFKMNKAILVFVAIVHLAYVRGQTCDLYKCFDDDLRIYQIYGNNYTCNEYQFCNIVKLRTNGACKPCMNITDVCGATFECDGDKTVTLKVSDPNEKLTCNGNTVCNSDPKINCKPCIPPTPPKCPKQTFKCVDEKHVILENFVDPLECEKDKVCNKGNVPPCYACISPDDASGPAEIGTTNDLPKPNCSDGSGWSKPCRPGSKSIYFRCINKVFWWEYEEASCTSKEKDYLCKDDKTIC